MEHVLSPAAPPSGAPAIKDSDTANFAADVIEASREVPVIVDFWAEWCGPCKQLTPMLEKLVGEAQGAVRMVKIDVDANKDLAAQLRVQSIPTVFAFKDGRPVDGFTGAVPESQIKEFIKRLAGEQGPSPVDEAIAMAKKLLEDGETDAAGNIFNQVLAQDETNIAALAGLARCAIAAGTFDEARAVLAKLPPEADKNADITAAKAALELAEQGEAAGDSDDLRYRVEQNANDHQARIDLATALFSAGNAQSAIDHLLESVGLDRAWEEEAARKQLVKFFDALGPTHEATVNGRRRLSSILFS
ncbi:MAG: thioredoxin [Alphaproteobacteria bacterium]|nr:thioredoxin [Alphaproteobacteria bacterium]